MNLKHVVWKCPCASLLYRIFITKLGVSAFSDVCACVRACMHACVCVQELVYLCVTYVLSYVNMWLSQY